MALFSSLDLFRGSRRGDSKDGVASVAELEGVAEETPSPGGSTKGSCCRFAPRVDGCTLGTTKREGAPVGRPSPSQPRSRRPASSSWRTGPQGDHHR